MMKMKAKTNNMAAENLKYKDAVEEIESILRSIEKDEPDVDELAEKVRRVTFLLKFCKEKLYKTQDEVEKVLKEMEDNNS